MDFRARDPQTWLVTLVLFALLASGGLGCASDPRVRLQPVRGQVVCDGRPVAGALVVFHPLGEYPEGLPRPLAHTDAAGRFRLTTERPGDGVPVGEYAVTVVLREKTRTGVEKVKGRNLLPARYGKPESSGLRCRVREGQEEVSPLLLTVK